MIDDTKYERGPIHRIFWTTVYATTIVFSLQFVISLWEDFIANPTVTSLVSSTYPSHKIPFPGIAVCNVNKISKYRATELQKLINKVENKSIEDVLRYAKYIGQLHDLEFTSSAMSDMIDFQEILETLNLSIRNITKMLASSCEDMLSECSWKGQKVPCAEIFDMRLTYMGYCCAFNYQKKTIENRETYTFQNPEKSREGLEYGLSYTVKFNTSDYWYTDYSTICFTTLVFVPTDYPDVYSGSLRQVLLTINTESFIEILPTVIEASEEVLKHPVEKRLCLFESERPTNFYGPYSPSDCNVDCRVRSILALCECIPFLIPGGEDDEVCTVADLQCLNIYRRKWSSLAPTDETDDDQLHKEEQTALWCNETCYSSCGGISYEVASTHLPLTNLAKKSENDSYVHIYFGNHYVNLYRMDVAFYWFEILSNFGGAFSLTLGLCLSTVLEVLIYIGKKLSHLTFK